MRERERGEGHCEESFCKHKTNMFFLNLSLSNLLFCLEVDKGKEENDNDPERRRKENARARVPLNAFFFHNENKILTFCLSSLDSALSLFCKTSGGF